MAWTDKEISDYFKNMTPKQRSDQRCRYQLLIDIELDRAEPVVNKISGKKVIFSKMPWMLTAWERALRLLDEVINEN